MNFSRMQTFTLLCQTWEMEHLRLYTGIDLLNNWNYYYGKKILKIITLCVIACLRPWYHAIYSTRYYLFGRSHQALSSGIPPKTIFWHLLKKSVQFIIANSQVYLYHFVNILILTVFSLWRIQVTKLNSNGGCNSCFTRFNCYSKCFPFFDPSPCLFMS